MYYIIVEKFGKNNVAKWNNYLQWRGLELESFDSVDGYLSPSLFSPKDAKDWKYCVNED